MLSSNPDDNNMWYRTIYKNLKEILELLDQILNYKVPDLNGLIFYNIKY